MKNIGLLWIFFNLVFFTIHAQKDPKIEELEGYIEHINMKKGLDEKYSDIKGNPFYFNDFTKGSIYMKNDKRVDDVMLNYNKFEDEFFYIGDMDRKLVIGNPEDIQIISLNNTIFRYGFFQNPQNEEQSGFLIVLEEGDCSLFKRVTTEFKDAEKGQAYSSPKPARFEDKEPQYYIKTGPSGSIRYINSFWKRRFLKTYFPNQKDELLKIIKDNDLNLNKEEDLIRFVQLYNGIS